MIILPENLESYKKELGPKTLNLKKLKDLGLNVPAFVALPTSTVKKLWGNYQTGETKYINSLIDDITKSLPFQNFAVRSSALIEDSSKSSYAGQFLTKTAVSGTELGLAIMEVINDAEKKLNRNLELFSIIIQDFIEADYSGIAFTRDPRGGREMLIECSAGAGENIVSGKTIPERKIVFWTQNSVVSQLPNFKELIGNFKKIEIAFNRPQDIEWCLKNGEYFYLQARPITTVATKEYEQILFLDTVLPKDEKFLYEKTEISEIAQRPTPFTLSLLELIYKAGGPVEKIYSKHGIGYEHQNFIKIVGNELYVDREKEIKTLLPSYSYINSTNLQPKFHSFRKIFTTIKNIFKLNTIKSKPEELLNKIKPKLASVSNMTDFDSALDLFLKDYGTIFEINLLAEKAIKRLGFFASKEKINESLLLTMPLEDNNIEDINVSGSNWQGNSLEISDFSTFVNQLSAKRNNKAAEHKIFAQLPKWKQTQLKPIIAEAQMFSRLREYGRWLTVKNINLLRQKLLSLAKEKGFKNTEHIFFLRIEELKNGEIGEPVAILRKEFYSNYLKYNLPLLLTNIAYTSSASELKGVSPGVAEGRLVDLSKLNNATGPVILYTKTLTPDLVQYFPKIKGIVSEKGGVLSHLAIMARENQLPVLVGFQLGSNDVKLDYDIKIDGSTGKIDHIQKRH